MSTLRHYNEQNKRKMAKKMKVLVDMMNIVFISFYATRMQIKKEQGRNEFLIDDIPFFLHFLLNKMNFIFSEFGVLDICWDGKDSLEWRRSIFPDYKRNRDKTKNDISYKNIISSIPKIVEVLNYYPCRQIEVEKVEADDVIFSLSKKYAEEEILIISSDGDLSQIINYFGEKINQYHPIKKTYYEPSKYILEEKAIVGDMTDNIPGLFRVGIKTFEKMLADKATWNSVITKGNNKKIYESFLNIIDLRKTPFEQKILDKEKTIEYNKFQPDEVELFLWDNKLKDLLHRWPKIKNSVWSKINVNV